MKNNQLTTASHFSPAELQTIAVKCDTNGQTLSVILNGENNRLRELIETDEDKCRVALQGVIFILIETHTNVVLMQYCEEANKKVLTDYARILLAGCIKETLKKFKHFSFDDIKEAFSHAADDPKNLASYYNKFTVPAFISILNKYNTKRNKIRQKYDANLLLLAQPNEEARREEMNVAAVEQMLNNYCDFVEASKKGETISADAVPVHWGPRLAELGRLNVSVEEKATIYAACKIKALNDLKLKYSDKKLDGYQKNTLKKTITAVLNHIASGGDSADNEEIRAAAIVLYKKRIVLASIHNDANK